MVEAALGKLEHHHEGELNAIQSKVERLATRCSALMARSALPSSETVYMDSDLSCAVPGEVAEQFDLLWALGAMASLAHAESTISLSRTAFKIATEVLLCALEQFRSRVTLLQKAWHGEKQAMLDERPHLRYAHDQVDFRIVGERTPRPFFKVMPRE